MSTVYANTISLDGGITNLPIYADRAEKDQNGDNIEQTYAKKSGLATVATSGDYDDLTNKPSIPAAQVNADWNASSGVSEILNKPSLAAVATSGDYNDLTNKPVIPPSAVVDPVYDPTSANAQSGTAVAGAISGKQDTISDLSDIRSGAAAGATAVQPGDLATVATTGDYDDLLDKPTIPAAQVNSDWNAVSGVAQILNKPSLSAVATSGDYNDLSNKPSIPAAQVNSDWNAVSGVTQILNKPSLAAVATSGDYNDLSNTPTINNVPAVTSADDDKVLKASYSGGVASYSWEQETAQVQSDWTESDTTDPAYIQNKPTEKNLVAGANITITESGNNVTVATTVNGVPGVTSTDTGKYLKADYNGGSPTVSWDIVPTNTYTGGNMISISNNVVGVLTTAGITDVQVVSALPASTVSTVLYLIPET